MDENGEGHTVLFLPDRKSEALPREREPPVLGSQVDTIQSQGQLPR